MNNYYIIEIQSNADGTSGILPFGYANEQDALDKFLDTWKSAQRSSVLVHTVMFITNRGVNVRPPVVYVHPQPQPEPNEE